MYRMRQSVKNKDKVFSIMKNVFWIIKDFIFFRGVAGRKHMNRKKAYQKELALTWILFRSKFKLEKLFFIYPCYLIPITVTSNVVNGNLVKY